MQDELHEKFDLNFKIATTDSIEAAATGNWFQENDLAICRLDKLSRDEAIQEKLKVSAWDLIICDEAHKMSATYTGGELRGELVLLGGRPECEAGVQFVR